MFAAFSNILEKVGSKLIGLKSLSSKGTSHLGIGVIRAFFHLSGNMLNSNEIFIMWVRTVEIRGKNKSIVEIFMPSIPLDLDFIDLTILITSSSEIGWKENLWMQGLVFFIKVRNSTVYKIFV